LIAELIRQGSRDFYVRQKAIRIFREAGAPPKDRWAEVCALFHWVRGNVRYTRDIFRTELLHTARRMIELRAGDCDDMTILLGAMLISTGHPVRLALTGFRPNKPHRYSHIYPEVHVKGTWIALDATIDRPALSPSSRRSRLWPWQLLPLPRAPQQRGVSASDLPVTDEGEFCAGWGACHDIQICITCETNIYNDQALVSQKR
jgi:transglutaminase-like putative cysteine protease